MADAGGKRRREPGKLSFGGGEFWKPGVAEAPRHEARRLFLECVLEVEPLVLGDLREYVLPLYLNWNGKPALHKVILPERTGPTTGKALARKPSFPAWFVSWIGCY
ncbi:MAG: hypothetical protein KDH09_00245, partial [Chrysiogenetes bacterium]|nr:hypothetical protein [Chrysiogenetes bacterium]